MTDHDEAHDSQRPLDPESFARYALRDRREILQLLNAVLRKKELLTAFVDNGPSFLTIVLAVDEDTNTVTIDSTPDANLDERAGSAAHVICVTRLDNVKIQFTLETPARVLLDERSALRAPIPESLLRLQRREHFRVPAPVSDPLLCMIPHVLPDGSTKSVPVRILDISGGGLAVMVPPDEIAFEPGTEFPQCAVMLPDGAPLAVNLKVRNLFHVEKPNGVKVLRAGCEFGGLSNQATTRIQRYLLRLQRDIRARES